MRWMSGISLAVSVAMAVPTVAADIEAGPIVLWCRAEESVRFSDCRHARPPDVQGWLAVRIEDDCIGSPGLPDEPPRCVDVSLGDSQGNPVDRECAITICGAAHEVAVSRRLHGSRVRVPVWADGVEVRCPGLEDVKISPDDRGRQVRLEPGRAVELRIVDSATAQGFGGKSGLDGRIALRRTDSEAGLATEEPLREVVSFGSLALGRYRVTVEADGFARIVDEFTLSPSDDSFELRFELQQARCLPVHLACEGCGGDEVSYSVQRLTDSKPPIPFSKGVLDLVRDDRWVFRSEICGLADGRYEVTLSAPGKIPMALPVRVGPSSDPVGFELAGGIPSSLFLVDSDGLPVAGAEIVLGWRLAGRPQRHTTSSSADGEAAVPPLPPGEAFGAYIIHDDFTPLRVHGEAGDRRVVQLTPRGRVVARLVGEACSDPVEVIATFEEVREAGYQGASGRHAPDNCRVEFPVEQPGTYRVEFRGPGFVPHVEEIEVAAGRVADLGDIELRPGGLFEVRMVHHGEPVAGATVRIGREGLPVVTGSSGVAAFQCLDLQRSGEEMVEIYVSHPKYAARRVARTVEDGDEIVISLTEGAEIHGLVMTEAGAPAVGETVTVAQPDGHAYSVTVDGTGRYRIDRLAPGRWMVYRMQVSSRSGTAGMVMQTGQSKDVVLRDGESREVSFLPAVEVSGRVFIEGQLADHAMTLGAVRDGSNASSVIPVRVDDLGSYSVALPEPGMWVFVLDRFSYTALVEGCPCVVDVFLTTASKSRFEGGAE